MHQELEQELQRIDSNAFEVFHPAVRDMMLTKTMHRFITSRISELGNRKRKGFQDSLKRDQDLQSLLVFDEEVPVVLTPLEYVRGRFPQDLLFYVKGRAPIYYDCNGVTQTPTTYNEYYYILNFDDDVPYTGTKIWDGASTTVYDPDDAADLITEMGNKDEKFYLINVILNSALDGWKIYWQSYRDVYAKDSFIIVAPDNSVPTLQLDVNSVTVETDNVRTLAVGSQPGIPDGLTPYRRDLREMETASNFSVNPFAKTRWDSPVCQIGENYIDVWTSESFILNRMYVTYIRKPKPISIYLGWDCELSESTHYEIVTMTAQHMKIITENPNAQLTAQDFIE